MIIKQEIEKPGFIETKQSLCIKIDEGKNNFRLAEHDHSISLILPDCDGQACGFSFAKIASSDIIAEHLVNEMYHRSNAGRKLKERHEKRLEDMRRMWQNAEERADEAYHEISIAMEKRYWAKMMVDGVIIGLSMFGLGLLIGAFAFAR